MFSNLKLTSRIQKKNVLSFFFHCLFLCYFTELTSVLGKNEERGERMKKIPNS